MISYKARKGSKTKKKVTKIITLCDLHNGAKKGKMKRKKKKLWALTD